MRATIPLDRSSVMLQDPISYSHLLMISGTWRGAVTLGPTDSTIKALFASLAVTVAFSSFKILKVF